MDSMAYSLDAELQLHHFDHVFLCSGGVDSAYLTVTQKPQYETGLALFVDYQQPSVRKERTSARIMAKSGGCTFRQVSVAGMPLGDMETGSGAQVVPARNVWLIALAAAFGRTIWIGCAPQDQREYADCRLEFLHSMDVMLRTIGKRLRWSEAERATRIETLKEHDVYELCWSCYGPGPSPCGECQSCLQ